MEQDKVSALAASPLCPFGALVPLLNLKCLSAEQDILPLQPVLFGEAKECSGVSLSLLGILLTLFHKTFACRILSFNEAINRQHTPN